MPLDTVYRHQQALDPSALTIVTNAVHAVAAAINDCRAAGNDPDNDAAILLLARHLGRIAASVPQNDERLRQRCAEEIAIIREQRHPASRACRPVPLPPDAPRIAA